MSGRGRAGTAPTANGRGLVRDLGGSRLEASAIGPGIVRLRWTASGSWRPVRSWRVLPDPEDLIEPGLRLELDAEVSAFRTPELEVGLADGLLVADRNGRVLVRQVAGRGPSFDPATGWARWSLEMPAGRRYLGFGERTGPLDKRGRRYTCWTTDEWRRQGPETDCLYLAIPFHLALDPDGVALGVFLDSTFRSAFDLTHVGEERLSIEAETDELDWYLIAGPDPARVVERFTSLVGRAPLPPRWALGYHQARWSYASDGEARAVAAGFRSRGLPLDSIHLDIDHMDGLRVFTWDRERFPDPAELVAELGATGLRTTVVVDAAVKRDPTGYDVYDQGRRIGAFVRRSRDAGADEVAGYVWPGECVLPDQTLPHVRAWWGSLYRRYLDDGFAGFLNDMNEPALHDRPIDDPETRNLEPPPETPFGPPAEGGTHAEVRNVYGTLENLAAFAEIRRARPDRRPYLVTRSGFAGVQRHAIVWTGDNWSEWEHLAMSLPQLLNLGLSGVPIAGADIGGFFGDCTAELYVRWMQLGAVYPFARGNSAQGTHPQEPWAWGEPTTSRCRRALELRSRLLPYLYTLAYEASRTGLPLLRPLLLEFPLDRRSLAVEDQAMLGDALLVAPILGEGETGREVALPPGRWYLFDATGGDDGDGVGRLDAAGSDGGQRGARPSRPPLVSDGTATAWRSATLDEPLPLFGRGGRVVPCGPVLQWSDERPLDPLTLHVFLDHDGTARGFVYEDDGLSLAYEQGEWLVTEVRAVTEPDGSVRVEGRREGAFTPPARSLELIVYGAPSSVDVDRAADPPRPLRVARLTDAPAWSCRLPADGSTGAGSPGDSVSDPS